MSIGFFDIFLLIQGIEFSLWQRKFTPLGGGLPPPRRTLYVSTQGSGVIVVHTVGGGKPPPYLGIFVPTGT